jgi:hypothetical protein
MIPRITTGFLLAVSLLLASARADTKSSSPTSRPEPMTKETRMMVIRGLNAEHVFARTYFPMGEKGLALKNGKLEPSAEKIQQMLAEYGPAAKPGDRIMITDVEIKDHLIHFEINGGPKKKQKWYQRIQVSGMGGSTVQAPVNNANPRGSFVDLEFDHYVPEISPEQIKKMLSPVFDFNAKSPAEAYLETLPPKLKQAIKDHQILVGMNHEMVTYAKGRPPQKIREKDATGKEYEEWIYGAPPEDVEFVRFVGDEVVRLETMKVDGQKVVKTQKEIDIKPTPSLAEAQQPGKQTAAQQPATRPTLRRPGEPEPDVQRSAGPGPMPMPVPPGDTPGPSGPGNDPGAGPQMPGGPGAPGPGQPGGPPQ